MCTSATARPVWLLEAPSRRNAAKLGAEDLPPEITADCAPLCGVAPATEINGRRETSDRRAAPTSSSMLCGGCDAAGLHARKGRWALFVGLTPTTCSQCLSLVCQLCLILHGGGSQFGLL